MSIEDVASSKGIDESDPYGDDLYTEPAGDADTLSNLGPLAAMAGVWEGLKGFDQHPQFDGLESDVFVERYDLQPVDRQTNGPQLYYGLRYHTHIVRPGEVETFHDQVGYWLWEPAADAVTFSLSIPRGQALLASGHAGPTDTEFEVRATIGSSIYGILSNPFLDRAFKTVSFRMNVSINSDGTWSYEEESRLMIPGFTQPFLHVDSNTLTRIGPPIPNPMARSTS
jgi:hypothetical protein